MRFTFGASNNSVSVIQTSDSTAKLATSGSGSVSITALGEGVTGTGALLVLPRVFLNGNSLLNGIEAGDDAGCGLISLGQGFCWGINNHGQLGARADSTCFPENQTTTISGDSVVSAATPCSLLPIRISRDIDFATIASGDSTGCAISIAGRAYCWGMNSFGQIGNGQTGDRAQPTLVTSALTFNSITVGGAHTCALTTAGAAYCWGADSFGQLGDARVVHSTTPIPVSGGEAIATFASISAVGTDGNAYCWGSNVFGGLGNTLQAAFRGFPQRVATPK